MIADTGQRPTWAEIDLNNLAFNFKSVKSFIGDTVKYMAVVKADAYGHGALQCAKRLEAEGIDWFGVALPEEGVELRRAGIRKLILCLGGFWPGQESLVLNNRLTPVVFQFDRAEALNNAARIRGTVAAVHVKIDTGMGRIGVRFDDAAEFAEALRGLRHLSVEGLMTHFAAADDLNENDFTDLQIKRFTEATIAFRDRGHNPVYLDMANSPGAVAHPSARSNMVRLGGVLYGLGGDVLPPGIEIPELRPVLALKTRIAFLKRVPKGETLGYGRTFESKSEMTVATLPIGYQDGYNRLLSNNGQILVRGIYCPVVGRISMDWTIVDVTEIPGAVEGDEVILIGDSSGNRITAEDLAGRIGTISYEVTCAIDRRVPRKFLSVD
ncbi:MAG TPA: alanine racemase [Pyrinomonadaceae bacterium]|nr:alanine racemase [Pyrinomonadaceae bacterium]